MFAVEVGLFQSFRWKISTAARSDRTRCRTLKAWRQQCWWDYRVELVCEMEPGSKVNACIIISKAIRPEIATQSHRSQLGIDSVFWPRIWSDLQEIAHLSALCVKNSRQKTQKNLCKSQKAVIKSACTSLEPSRRGPVHASMERVFCSGKLLLRLC